jgi:hypothetical protein
MVGKDITNLQKHFHPFRPAESAAMGQSHGRMIIAKTKGSAVMEKLSMLVVATSIAIGVSTLSMGAESEQDVAGQSTAQAFDLGTKTLRTESLGISPQVGILAYTNGSGNYVARGASGLTVDGNLGKYFLNQTRAFKDFYVGVTSGAVYSHFGSSSTNFFGSNSDDPDNVGADILVIPTNLKVGYYLTENIRDSGHGGGNLIYTSASQSVNFGQGAWNSGTKWNYYPNAGGDVEVAITPVISLSARPDVTFFTTGETLFTGTLGIHVSVL